MSGIQAKILNFHHGETGSRTGEILTGKTEKRSASSCGPTKPGTIITAEYGALKKFRFNYSRFARISSAKFLFTKKVIS